MHGFRKVIVAIIAVLTVGTLVSIGFSILKSAHEKAQVAEITGQVMTEYSWPPEGMTEENARVWVRRAVHQALEDNPELAYWINVEQYIEDWVQQIMEHNRVHGTSEEQEIIDGIRSGEPTSQERFSISPSGRIYVYQNQTPITYEWAIAVARELEHAAAQAGQEYNPHGHTPDGRRVMLQNNQVAQMMAAQEAGYCFDTKHLPEQAPEGSEIGCACGANCDEHGKPTAPENGNCERHCKRDLCKCGTCF